jgi:hypothetical protein
VYNTSTGIVILACTRAHPGLSVSLSTFNELISPWDVVDFALIKVTGCLGQEWMLSSNVRT